MVSRTSAPKTNPDGEVLRARPKPHNPDRRPQGSRLALAAASAIALWLPLASAASGACCSVTKGEAGVPNVAVLWSAARSHESFHGEHATLRQQALVLKLSYPLGNGFALQGYAGVPLASRLSSHGGMSTKGYGGVFAGAGVGYVLPKTLGRWEFSTSLSWGWSKADLGPGHPAMGPRQMFTIRELQAILLAERPISSRASLYAGLRAYSGRSRWRGPHGVEVAGAREGNAAPLIGVRIQGNRGLGCVVEAGFGHTRLLSAGAIFSF